MPCLKLLLAASFWAAPTRAGRSSAGPGRNIWNITAAIFDAAQGRGAAPAQGTVLPCSSHLSFSQNPALLPRQLRQELEELQTSLSNVTFPSPRLNSNLFLKQLRLQNPGYCESQLGLSPVNRLFN